MEVPAASASNPSVPWVISALTWFTFSDCTCGERGVGEKPFFGFFLGSRGGVRSGGGVSVVAVVIGREEREGDGNGASAEDPGGKEGGRGGMVGMFLPLVEGWGEEFRFLANGAKGFSLGFLGLEEARCLSEGVFFRPLLLAREL